MVALERPIPRWRLGSRSPLVRPLLIIIAVLAFGAGQVFGHAGSLGLAASHTRIATSAPGTQAVVSLATVWTGLPTPVPVRVHFTVARSGTAQADAGSDDRHKGSNGHHDGQGNGWQLQSWPQWGAFKPHK